MRRIRHVPFLESFKNFRKVWRPKKDPTKPVLNYWHPAVKGATDLAPCSFSEITIFVPYQPLYISVRYWTSAYALIFLNSSLRILFSLCTTCTLALFLFQTFFLFAIISLFLRSLPSL